MGNLIRLNNAKLNSSVLGCAGECDLLLYTPGTPVPPAPEPDVPVEPTTYTLIAEVANGVVSAELNGVAVQLPYTATEGDVIVLEVTPAEGYEFVSWADGNMENPRTIAMTSNVTLSASCEVVTPTNPDVDENGYIIFEDAEVARICAENWGDGTGITLEQAAAVTTIRIAFRGNATIVSFNELDKFRGVTGLTDAFAGCASLQSINLNNIRTVSRSASDGCFFGSALIEAIMPNAVSVGTWGFRGTTLLERAFLGQNCASIASWGFNNCTKLSWLVCAAATPPTLNSNALSSKPNIYVPDASVAAYREASVWSSYASRIFPISQLSSDNPELYAEIEEYL